MVKIENLNEVSEFLVEGCLVLPKEQHKLAPWNVQLNCAVEWAFDFSMHNSGIWIRTDERAFGGGCWYKLLKPTAEYLPFYAPFQAQCMLWIHIFQVFIFKNDTSYENVIKMVMCDVYLLVH